MIRGVFEIHSMLIRNMFKFDLKHLICLGFSENIDAKVRYFVHTVLPVRLETAPLLFGKITHPVVNYWSKSLLKVAYFLVDGSSLLESFFDAIPVHILYKKLCKNAILL